MIIKSILFPKQRFCSCAIAILILACILLDIHQDQNHFVIFTVAKLGFWGC
jgi:hypothetical protein